MSNLNSIQQISNIVNVKKKVNSIFVVPSSSSSSSFSSTTTTTTTPTSSQILTIQKNQIASTNNKITVIPINLNLNTSSTTITKTVPSTTPIKIINNNSTTPLNPLNTNTKKIVINNNLNHITKTIGSVNLSSSNNNESINKPVHVVKIINTPSNSSGIKIATVQHNTSSALASLLNTNDLANQQQQQPLKLHTYQINKQPKLSTNNIYVQPTTATLNQQHQSTTTVVHKIPTTITKTISNQMAPKISTIMNYKSQNENNIPPISHQQQQQQNVRPQITVISANSNHKIIHNTITNSSVNNNESLNENDSSSTLDTDAIKLIVRIYFLIIIN